MLIYEGTCALTCCYYYSVAQLWSLNYIHEKTNKTDRLQYNPYKRTKALRTIRLKSQNSYQVKLLLVSKSYPQQIGMTPEVLTGHFSTQLPPTYIRPKISC